MEGCSGTALWLKRTEATSPWEVVEASGSLTLLSIRGEADGRLLAGSTEGWGFLLPPVLCANNPHSPMSWETPPSHVFRDPRK